MPPWAVGVAAAIAGMLVLTACASGADAPAPEPPADVEVTPDPTLTEPAPLEIPPEPDSAPVDTAGAGESGMAQAREPAAPQNDPTPEARRERRSAPLIPAPGFAPVPTVPERLAVFRAGFSDPEAVWPVEDGLEGWVPGGNRVAFVQRIGGHPALVAGDPETGSVEPIVFLLAGATESVRVTVRPSPDDRFWAVKEQYGATRTEAVQLYSWETGESVILVGAGKGTSPARQISFKWSPTGDAFLLSIQTPAGDGRTALGSTDGRLRFIPEWP